MIIFGHDLSTKSGWAILEDGKLVDFGNVESDPKDFGVPYPASYIIAAKTIAESFKTLWKTRPRGPFVPVIEETNKSSRFTSRYSQKLLEFIHFAVCEAMIEAKMQPRYMNTSEWRKLAHVTIDERSNKINKEVERQRGEHMVRLEGMIRPAVAKQMMTRFVYDGPKSKDFLKKKIDEEVEKLVRQEMGKFRATIAGTVIGQQTRKHLAIQRANALFGTTFELRDNDIAEAALLAYGYHIKVTQQKRSK